MAIPLYLAMTGMEKAHVSPLPPNIAWMSCLFSPYGRALSNLPRALPSGSLLILSDRTPICGHDHGRIFAQLEEVIGQFSCCGLLLDFEMPKNPELAELSRSLLELPCPVALSERYAKDLTGPVFLPPVPPDTPVEEYLVPWAGREVWLEMALEQAAVEVTEKGCFPLEGPGSAELSFPFYDEALCCHYGISLTDRAIFHFQRQKEDLETLLTRAEALGVTKAVGLYQELG